MGPPKKMMNEPESKSDSEIEKFEWVQEDGKLFKITDKNSEGRKCECCGCACPCDCKCCGVICCTVKKRLGLS